MAITQRKSNHTQFNKNALSKHVKLKFLDRKQVTQIRGDSYVAQNLNRVKKRKREREDHVIRTGSSNKLVKTVRDSVGKTSLEKQK